MEIYDQRGGQNQWIFTELNDRLKVKLLEALKEHDLTISKLAPQVLMTEEKLESIFSNPLQAYGPDLFIVLKILNLNNEFLELSQKQFKPPRD